MAINSNINTEPIILSTVHTVSRNERVEKHINTMEGKTKYDNSSFVQSSSISPSTERPTMSLGSKTCAPLSPPWLDDYVKNKKAG